MCYSLGFRLISLTNDFYLYSILNKIIEKSQYHIRKSDNNLNVEQTNVWNIEFDINNLVMVKYLISYLVKVLIQLLNRSVTDCTSSLSVRLTLYSCEEIANLIW